MHKQKLKINTILISIITFLLIVCGISKMNIPWGNILLDYVGDRALEKAQRAYLPGFVYREDKMADSLEEWIISKTENVVPLGTFVLEQEQIETDSEDMTTYQMILLQQANDENVVDENGRLIGKDDSSDTIYTKGVPIDTSLERMKDFNYLLSNFYTVDSSTMIREDELNGELLLSKNMKINQEIKGPKVLIYHTHSQEAFVDSVSGDTSTTIVGMGEYLAELLNETYQIETIHHTGVYDLIEGRLDRSKAYDLAKPDIQKILQENPSIEVVIDLHRDGVGENTHLVTEVNGQPTAQIMFFNGLSKTRANGEIDYLANPYIQDNLAFSLQMQLAANAKYPGFTRRIYLRGYRYNMHFMPKSLLVEAGAQTNTVKEMRNAMEVLADILDTVLVSGK